MKFFNDSLLRISQFVLEDWAMMLVDDGEEGAQSFDKEREFYIARTEYTSVFCGSIYVICQQEFTRTLAENLLGLDTTEELNETDCQDALKEFANVVSGNFLTDAFGEEAVFDLPKISIDKRSFSETEQYLDDSSIYFIGDTIPLAIRVEIAADEEDSLEVS